MSDALDTANAEYLDLLKWFNAECEKITQHLKVDGKVCGLDGHQAEFLAIRVEMVRRFNELCDRYNLSNKMPLPE